MGDSAGRPPPSDGRVDSRDPRASLSDADVPFPNRQLAAVMFTDMEGYTALMQRDERAALGSRGRHRAAVEEVAASFGGRVLQYFGDGSLSVYPSAVEAVRAALDLQRRVRMPLPLPLRVGLHLGDIAFDAQGAYGDAVNIAARIEGLCPAGGVLVSGRVADELRNHPDLATRAVGRVRLKNVREPVDLHALAAEGFPVPALDSVGSAGEDVDALSPAALAHLRQALGRPPYRSRTYGDGDARPPLVGREREARVLEHVLRRTEEGHGGVAFLRGGRGVGKSRLAEATAEGALERGWWVAMGRSWPAERRIPFAPFADAFQPALQGLSAADRAALAPGAEDILRHVLPALGSPLESLRLRYSEPGELKTRIFWHFSALLGGLGRRAPLLFILEDAQWADPSSVELFHFVARQCTADRVAFLCVHADPEPEQERALRSVERSLRSVDRITSLELEPLSAAATAELVREMLGRSGRDVEALAARLHRWTGGNAFFTEGVLGGLLESGRVMRGEGDGADLGRVELELPRSVREAVLERVGRVGPEARGLAEVVAVMGARTSHDALAAICGVPEPMLLDALDELRRYRVLAEHEVGPAVAYDFVHPLIGEALRSDLSLARRRALHQRIAVRLEKHLGPGTSEHSDELAYHYARAHPGQVGEKAVRYLVAAGRRALARHANREAADYFRDALERIDATGADPPGDGAGPEGTGRVVEGLAKARTRLGEHEEAVRMWRRALGLRRAAGDRRGEARIHREIGLMLLWSDQLDEAVEELGAGVAAARQAGDEALEAVIQLAASITHQYAGRPDAAQRAVEEAIEIADRSGDPSLRARAHGALLRLRIWTGQLQDVRALGEEALRLARECGDPAVAFWSQWALSVAEGLFGNIREAGLRIAEARRIADDVGSPILGLWTDEFNVEHCYSTGDWKRGLEVGERAIRLARDLNQKTILPRVLVWTALIHIGQGNYGRARALTDEAWGVSGADGVAVGRRGLDLHTVVPAHIGRAALSCAVDDWDETIRLGELGGQLAERSGYVVWGLHRLLPLLAEAHVHRRNLEGARGVARRMRELSEPIGHDLGLAWSEACEAVLTWLEGDVQEGARRLEAAADRLEAIPMIWEAARLRRQLVGRLIEIGDFAAAKAHLDRVHAACLHLGARLELARARNQYAEIGEEPPELPDEGGAPPFLPSAGTDA